MSYDFCLSGEWGEIPEWDFGAGFWADFTFCSGKNQEGLCALAHLMPYSIEKSDDVLPKSKYKSVSLIFQKNHVSLTLPHSHLEAKA